MTKWQDCGNVADNSKLLIIYSYLNVYPVLFLFCVIYLSEQKYST